MFIVFGFGLVGFSAASVSAAGITIPTGTGLPNVTDTTGQGPVVQVVLNFMAWLLGIFMLLAVIAFVVTGIQYLTSMGDPYKAEGAKKAFIYSVTGVAAVGGALVLINTIDALLR